MMRLRQTVDKADRKQQEEIRRHEGQTVDLRVTAEDFPTGSQLQFVWTKNEAEIRVGARCGIHPLPSGSHLCLSDLSTVDTGLYRCQVVNSHEDQSLSFSLTVEECELSNIHNFKDRIRNLKTKTERERGGRRSIKKHYQNQHFTELVVDSPPTQRRQNPEVDSQSTTNDAFLFWAVSKRSGRFPISVQPEHKEMSSSPRSSSSPPPDSQQQPWSSPSPSKECRVPSSETRDSVGRLDDSRRFSSPAVPSVPLRPAGRKFGARMSVPAVETPKVPPKSSVLSKLAKRSSTSQNATIPQPSSNCFPHHKVTAESDSPGLSVTSHSAPKLPDDSVTVSESTSYHDESLRPSDVQNDSSGPPKVPDDAVKSSEEPKDSAKPLEVPDDAAKISEVPDDAEKPSEVPDDAEKPSEVPDDAVKPSEVPDDAEKPSEVPDDAEKTSDVPDDTVKISDVPDDAVVISEVPDDTEEPSEVSDGAGKLVEVPDDAEKPSEVPDDDVKPSEVCDVVVRASEVPDEDVEPSEVSHDFQRSVELLEDTVEPDVLNGDATELVNSHNISITPPIYSSPTSNGPKSDFSSSRVPMNHIEDNRAAASVVEGSTFSPEDNGDKSFEVTGSTTSATMNGGIPKESEKDAPSKDAKEDEDIAVVNVDLRSRSRDSDTSSVSDRKLHGSCEGDDGTSTVMSERPTSMVQFRQEQVPKEEIPFPEREVELKTGVDPWSHYEQFERIGSGGFSEVFRCREISTGLDLAAKVARYRSSNKPSLMYEIDILRNLCHPRIMRLYDVYDYGRRMYLITEYIGGGELCERIIEEDFLSEEQACNFILQILRGVSYLHKQSIIHLDLKPENIVCTTKSTYDIKIIDFGFAQKYEGEHKPIHFLGGTANFTAPEVINYDPLTFAADVWAVGVMAYLLLCGYAPFDGDSDQEVLVNVTKGIYDYDDEIFDQISPSAREFIDKILVKNPSKRPTSQQLLRDDWLRARGRRSTIHNPAAVDHMRTFVTRARDKWKVATTAIMAMQKFRRV